MDWLTHNPIADLPGPQFLLIYGATAVAVIAAAYGAIRLLDQTDWRKPPRVPGTFDPYEMAYLCGGTNAVICTVVYAVYRRGAPFDRAPRFRFQGARKLFDRDRTRRVRFTSDCRKVAAAQRNDVQGQIGHRCFAPKARATLSPR